MEYRLVITREASLNCVHMGVSCKFLCRSVVFKSNWIQNLMLEAETAIARLPTNERVVYREIVADRIHTLTK